MSGQTGQLPKFSSRTSNNITALSLVLGTVDGSQQCFWWLAASRCWQLSRGSCRNVEIGELLGDAPAGWVPPQTVLKLQKLGKHRGQAMLPPHMQPQDPQPSQYNIPGAAYTRLLELQAPLQAQDQP